MYTSVAISQFFDKFQQQFKDYNFVAAIYDENMDFGKLKPFILNNENTENRDKSWCGIIFDRKRVSPGELSFRSFRIRDEYVDPDTGSVEIFKCSQSSCEVNFNIVSNELLHLEALENELQWTYNGNYEMTIDLPKLPSFKLYIGDIVYGDLTKYKSEEYGQICSLGMACTLNYPILLRDSNIKIIKKFNYYLTQSMPNNVFYHSEIPN